MSIVHLNLRLTLHQQKRRLQCQIQMQRKVQSDASSNFILFFFWLVLVVIYDWGVKRNWFSFLYEFLHKRFFFLLWNTVLKPLFPPIPPLQFFIPEIMPLFLLAFTVNNYCYLVGLPGLARVHLPAHLPTCLPACLATCRPPCTYINIRGLVINIPSKIPAIDSQSWLDKDFYIIRFLLL